MNIFEIFGTVAINNDQANKALSATGKMAKGLSNTMESAFSKVQSAALKIGTTVATAFAVDKIKDFGKSCAETYASVAAEQSAFEQIMGDDYVAMAMEKMNQVAENTGVVATRLTPYMTSMTAKFKGLGYGVDEATSLASEGLTIASDAAAFWDKSLDESMSHLNSFINGSYEGGEAIGLFANDTQMAAYAVEKGIVAETKAWSELDEATKQSTRLQYAKEMMKRSGATGQASKEAEQYANVQANLNEQFRQFQAIIGEPIMNNIMLPAMRRVSQYMPMITEKAEQFIKTYSEGFNRFASHFKTVFTDEGIDLSALPGAISGAISEIWPKIQDYFRVKLGIDLPKWADIQSNITKWWTGTKTSIEEICTWVMKLPENPSEAPDEIANAVKEWWDNTAIPAIKSVSGWTLQLFGHPIEDEATISQHMAEWWKVAGETVASACVWTLKLFDMPAESAEAIGNKVKTWWNSVLGAVDKETWNAFFSEFSEGAKEGLEDANSIFGLALDAISGLSKIGTEAVTKSLDWILTHGQETATILKSMAIGFLAAAAAANPLASSIVAAAFALGLLAEYSGEDRYDSWLEGYSKEEIQTLQEWIDAMNEFKQAEDAFWNDSNAENDEAYAAANARLESAQENLNAIEGLQAKYLAWNQGQKEYDPNHYLSIPARISDESESEMQAQADAMDITGIVKMMADTSNLQSAINAINLSYTVPVYPNVTNQPGRWINSIPGHADGLDFVPRDNYLARLHKGEAVLTSDQADTWRSGSIGNADIGRLESAINNLGVMMQQLVQNSKSGQQIVLDSGVLVGQLAPALDTQLGMISSRKGRRN